MYLQGRQCKRHREKMPSTNQGWRPGTDPPLDPFGGAWPCWYLGFRLLASGTETVNVCGVSFPNSTLLTQCLANWASLVAQLVKNPPVMQETPVQFLGQEDLLEKGKVTHSSLLGLPCGSAGKESACNWGDLGSIPGLGRSPGEGKGYPLQYSGLENSMGKESDMTERLSLSAN